MFKLVLNDIRFGLNWFIKRKVADKKHYKRIYYNILNYMSFTYYGYYGNLIKSY